MKRSVLLLLAGCSVALDYDALESGAPVPAPPAAEVTVTVRCGEARCAAGEVCCYADEDAPACTTTCAKNALPCDGTEDCGAGLVCCGAGKTSDDSLEVACLSAAACADRSGSRELCNDDRACTEGRRCIATETIPGARKCED